MWNWQVVAPESGSQTWLVSVVHGPDPAPFARAARGLTANPNATDNPTCTVIRTNVPNRAMTPSLGRRPVASNDSSRLIPSTAPRQATVLPRFGLTALAASKDDRETRH